MHAFINQVVYLNIWRDNEPRILEVDWLALTAIYVVGWVIPDCDKGNKMN